MMEYDLIMPKMGESITEATVLKWLIGVGDKVELDQPLLEIATDKVDSEIPSPVAGTITKILFSENDVVPIGMVIATINGAEDQSYPSHETIENDDFSNVGAESDPVQDEIPYIPVPNLTSLSEYPPMESNSDRDKFYSPLVRTIAKEENISKHELDRIEGSGLEGRVTKSDVIQYLNAKRVSTDPLPTDEKIIEKPVLQPSSVESPVTFQGDHEIMEMDRMRRLIADHMVMSKQVAPHVTSFVEVDVTEIVNWRNRNKASFQEKYNQNLTFTPVFIDAVVKAIKEYPLINSSVNGYQIIKKKDINIGMATALPSGNLIVPVIKNAERINLQGLALAVNDFARRARENQLKPDEVSGGTFTVTNVGSFGSLMGTPIINQPQVAILAVGTIRKKPMVLETMQGDVIAIRHCMFLSLSYDHRVIDGFMGGSFLKKISDLLETFDPNTII